MNIKQSVGALLVGATFLVLAACSTTPTRVEELEQARATVQQVEATPGAGEAAAQEVEQAHSALRRADELAARRASTQDIEHAAYLANRHAQIALQQIATAQSKDIVAKGETERERALLEVRAKQSAARAETATRQMQELQRQLADMHAKQTERGLVLTLGDVLFDTGQATLKAGAQSTLERLASFLKESPDSSVIIEGHTDSVGSDDYNMQLSQRRADAVRTALLERNVESQRIQAIGKGKGEPVATNSTAAGRQQNRRVEIVIQNAASRDSASRAGAG